MGALLRFMQAEMEYPVTPDGRYFVVRGRLWRCTNPKIPAKRRDKLVKDLMAARRSKDRAGVDKAKRALGERGPTWWKGPDYNRYLAKNTPYAAWNEQLPTSVQQESEKAMSKRAGSNARKRAAAKRT